MGDANILPRRCRDARGIFGWGVTVSMAGGKMGGACVMGIGISEPCSAATLSCENLRSGVSVPMSGAPAGKEPNVSRLNPTACSVTVTRSGAVALCRSSGWRRDAGSSSGLGTSSSRGWLQDRHRTVENRTCRSSGADMLKLDSEHEQAAVVHESLSTYPMSSVLSAF